LLHQQHLSYFLFYKRIFGPQQSLFIKFFFYHPFLFSITLFLICFSFLIILFDILFYLFYFNKFFSIVLFCSASLSFLFVFPSPSFFLIFFFHHSF